MAYRIEFAPDVEGHLRFLTVREQTIVLDAVHKHLVHQPDVITRNRKPMRSNPVAPWELRVGNLRGYFDCRDTPEKIVTVRAVGRKLRNRVMIGNMEVSL